VSSTRKRSNWGVSALSVAVMAHTIEKATDSFRSNRVALIRVR